MSILDTAELLAQADNYSGSGNWLDEANSHDAVNNGAFFKDYDGFNYVTFGDNNNRFRDATPPASASIDTEEVATVELWFRKLDIVTFRSAFSTHDGSTGIILRADNDGRRFEIRLDDGTTDLTMETDTAGPDDLAWHHIAVTIDHTAAVDEVNMYLDGSIVSGSPLDISSLGNITAEVMEIGRTGANNAMAGDFGFFAFHKVLATAGAISTASTAGAPTPIAGLTSPVTIWNPAAMTDPLTSYTDAQGNVYTIIRTAGSQGGATAWEIQLVTRKSWMLSVNDYLEIADDADLDFAAGDGMSAIVFLKPLSIAAGQTVLLSKKDDLTTAAGYALVRSAANSQFIIADGTLDDDDTAGTLVAHTPASIAGVRNVTDDDIEAFVDGTGSGSPTADSTTVTLANALVARIGATSGGTPANFFVGQIIAVALWRSALTDAEVVEAHNALIGVGGSNLMLMGVG